jgi:hypothetical protein
VSQEPLSQSGLSQRQHEAEALATVVDQANRWLARFAPLVRDTTAMSAQECRRRIALLEELRGSGSTVVRDLERLGGPGEAALASTLRIAVAQTDALEEDYRRRLAAFAPGDPQGSVDLEALQQDLAAVAARHEVEQATGTRAVRVALELETSPTNIGGAAFMGIFSVGWLSFTTVHAVFMIGGMFSAFGPLALALLAFYAIFFAVGFGMAYGAYQMALRETITLTGRHLLVRRSGFGKQWETVYDLASDATARIAESPFASANNQKPSRVIVLKTAEGKEVRLGRGASADYQRDCVARLNDYLGTER